jgi:hypothetical protein
VAGQPVKDLATVRDMLTGQASTDPAEQENNKQNTVTMRSNRRITSRVVAATQPDSGDEEQIASSNAK